MILVDTSVWVDHFRREVRSLSVLLETEMVFAHPFVIGEIALGNLRQRELVIRSLQNLPQAIVANEDEVMHFISENRLHGKGIGYIDAHLLAAVRLSAGATLWTSDRKLHAAAGDLGLAYESS